jgi:hypothetical protein
LLLPNLVHLVIALLVIFSLSVGERVVILFFGGWFVLLGLALLGIPFGALHLLQALYLAPKWSSKRQHFLVGLLNPSFAAITLLALGYLFPKFLVLE